MSTAAYEVKVDINRNGAFDHPNANITTYVRSAQWQNGLANSFDEVAPPARLNMVLDNSEGIFTQDAPSAASSQDLATWTASSADVTYVDVGQLHGGTAGDCVNLYTVSAAAPVSITKTNAVVVGSRYKMVLDVNVIGVSGGVVVKNGTTQVTPVYHTTGIKTFYFTATSADMTISSDGITDLTLIPNLNVYTTSLYDNALRRGTLIRIRATFNSATQQLYIGRIASVTPNTGAYTNKQITITCQDPMLELLEAEFTPELLTNTTTGAAIQTVFDQTVIAWPYESSGWLLGITGCSELGTTTTVYREAIIAAKGGQTFSSELFTDGGVEVWTNPTTLTNWTQFAAGTSTVNQDGATKYAGNYSARLDISAGGDTALFRQTVTASLNDFLEVTLWMKCSASSKLARLAVGSNAIALYPDTTGARYTTIMRVLADNPTVTFQDLSAAGTSLWFDALSCTKIVSGSNIVCGPDGTYQFAFTLPSTTIAGQQIKLAYRAAETNPFLNCWFAYIRRNLTNTDWDFLLDSVSSGTATNRISVTGVGNVNVIKVVVSGNDHTCFVGTGGFDSAATACGSTVTNTTHNTNVNVNMMYSDGVTNPQLKLFDTFTDIEAGSTTLPYIGDNSLKAYGTSAQTFIRDLVTAEAGGRFFFDARSSHFVFHNRHHDALTIATSSPPAYYFDLIDSMAQAYGDCVVNQAFVNYQPRELGTAGSIVWRTAEVLEIKPRESKKITARYFDADDTTAKIGVINPIAPQRRVDYVAYVWAQSGTAEQISSTGINSRVSLPMDQTTYDDDVRTQKNRTNRLRVKCTFGANSAQLELTNPSVSKSYYVSFQLRGTPLLTLDKRVAEARDGDSIRDNGICTKTIQAGMISDEDFAQSYAQSIVNRFKQAFLRVISLTFTANKNDTRMSELMSRKIGDVITPPVEGVVSAAKYVIVGERHVLVAGGEHTHAATWILLPADTVGYWILEDGLLDLTAHAAL